MLITLDDTRVTYNGNNFVTMFNSLREQGETLDFGLIAVTVESEQSIIFAASHNINTARAMYKEQDIITSQSGESITFNLTLCPVLDPLGSRLPQAWTNEIWTLLYTILDTRDYKPLIFGDATSWSLDNLSEANHVTGVGDHVSRPYYNCVPLVGSVSDLKMFENSQGYVTIPFICDAPHMWIDVQKTYSRQDSQQQASGWYFPNYSNVKDYSGQAQVYPIIKVYDFISSAFSGDNPVGYVSFANAETIEGEVPWFRMTDFVADDTLEEIVIDNYNKQIYGFNQDGNNIVLNDTNYIACLKPVKRFFSLPQEPTRHLGELTGGRQVWHRTYVCNGTSSLYKIQFFYSCPYMGGNIETDPITPGNESVMLHTNEEGS